ncbi:TetR/AcrR family transcriptional regulator [Mycolicibacterium sp. 050158]|uniref:TetR/AcrR family transcriptional regulator n=1 Tax=Mycolicibacterium sp. 050158 TaxID=3090602 RepID=UPI00299E97D5|nr:TetR/AcrR family transcriptional regulator [Mycolicibacterium sp. 050158]MDX1889046.1 TetR/AcrR family transcriptional regulator [Mycolicibacterium sp. 050158]
MSLKVGDGVPRRRRGAALEEAILDAAWSELSERGYDDFTIDAVAVRSGTSRAVLYRRWPSKPQLVHAALTRAVTKDPVRTPDTGSLRTDMIELLRQANRKRVRLATQLLTRLGDFYRDTGSSLANLGAEIQGGRNGQLMVVIHRAIDRGELESEGIPDRVASVAVDLFRYEVMMTLRPVPDEAILEIVDLIFLPLLEKYRPGASTS